MHIENWDDYRFILAVVEHGSLNAAARALGVNHATVLRRVTGFQDRHAIRVFDRDSHGYRLRADQAGLVESLVSLRTAFEAAERAVLGQGAGIHGPVKITSTDSLCSTVLPPMVAQLRQHHPDLSLELLASNSRLNFGQLDAEVTIRPAEKLSDELVGAEVAKLAFAVYGQENYLLNHKKKLPHQWLVGSGPLLRSPAGRWQQANVDPADVNFAADSFISLRELCLSGLGLAILPCCIVPSNSGLRQVRGFFAKMEVGLWVANHRDLDTVPRIVACRNFLSESLAQIKEVLAGRARDQ